MDNPILTNWFRQVGSMSWVSRAHCRRHASLPWVDDRKPTPSQLNTMSAICSGCPVIKECAVRGLESHGGFYAGVWLPWKSTSSESDLVKYDRATGRRKLREILGVRVGRPPGVRSI